MGKPKSTSSSSKKQATSVAGVDGKKQKRKTKQSRAGIEISVSRCRRIIGERWKGKVSAEAAVALAAFLQFGCMEIMTGAEESAESGIAEGVDSHRRISSGDVSVALAKHEWLRRELIKGRVIGAAPITIKQKAN